MSEVKLPRSKECFTLMEKYDFNEVLRGHSKKFKDISNPLTKKLKEQGIDRGVI